MLWDDAGTTPYEVQQARSRKPALADENRLVSSVIHHPPKFDTQLAETPFKNGVPVIASFNCSSLNVDTSVRNPEDSLEFAMINALTESDHSRSKGADCAAFCFQHGIQATNT